MEPQNDGRKAMLYVPLKTLGGIVFLLWLCMANVVNAEERQSDKGTGYEFDIPAQSLSESLRQLSNQTETFLLFPFELVEHRIGNPVKGSYTLQQAVEMLLEGSGLTGSVSKKQVLMISKTRSTIDGVPDDGTQNKEWGSSMQRRSSLTRFGAFVGSIASAVFSSLAHGQETNVQGALAERQLEEVVVTGTLLQPSGFTTPTPVTVVGQDFINARAPSDVGELLKEIPSLKIGTGPGVTSAGQRNSIGQSNVDFYGLGAMRTLVLIDGQRQTGNNISGVVDISTIPTLMIERVETITGGASATYGSDAVGGVANFILRNKIDGVTANAAWGRTTHNDKDVTSLNLGFGTDLGSRTNLLVGVDLSRDAGIESMYSRDWGRKEPGLFAYGNASAARGAQPASVWVNNYEQKNNTPGGIITGCTPAPCPASLTGIAFDADANPYSFVAGTTTPSSAFMYGNTSNYGNNPNGRSSLAAPYKRWTGLAKLNVDLTDDTQLKLTAGYSGMNGEVRADIVQTSTTVTTANPFLPASIRNAMIAAGKSSVTLGRSNFDLGYNYTGQVNRGFTAGAQLTGKIAGSWSYDTYYKFSQATSDGWQDGFRTADINAAFSNCTVTTGASAGCVGYNIFGVDRASQAALDYLTQYTQGFLVRTKQNVVQALVRGTPFSIWAGDVNVAAGAHYRKDAISRSLERDSLLFPSGGFSFGNYTPFSASRDVKEYFAEANVPLVRDVPVVQALNANLGYRYLDYSDNGVWNTWKAGLTWDIDEQVRLRVTRSRDIRAPNLFAQYGTGSVVLVANVVDPRTGQTITVNGGGLPTTSPSANPALHPEVADTTTAGLILQPRWVSGLRLSADYFRIKISDVIALTSAQQLVNGCLRDGVADLCQFITFSGPGQTGSILATRNSNVNFNQLDVAGYNTEIAYAIPGQFLAGNWDVRGLATYLDRFQTTDNFTKRVYDDIGTAMAGQPRLQTNLLLTYKHAAFSTTVSWRYFRGLKYSSSQNGIWVGPDDPLYYSTVNSTTTAPCPGGAATCQWYQTAPNSISQNKFPGSNYLNWSAQYQIGGMPLKDFQVYVKVDNVLDKDPPDFAYVAFNAVNMYDLVGRNYKVGVRASF